MQAPWPRDARYLRTGPLLVDLCYRWVECDGARHELQQRIFDLLLVFLARPNALHTRADLFQQLWPGVIVEDANLSQSVWLLRKALGEGGKHWIRTVAKSGYVFEPPGPLEWLSEHPDKAAPAEALAHDQAGAHAGELASGPPVPVAGMAAPAPGLSASVLRKRRWPGWAAAATIVVAVGLAFGLSASRGRHAASASATATPSRIVVAVVEVEDPAASSRWPARLLHDWLRWKLSSLPEVIFLSEADLAAARATPTAPLVVLVSAASAPDAAGIVELRARVRLRDGERRFEQRGAPDRVPAMVDALSAQVVAQLLPTRTGPWPRLESGPAAARRYAEASEAFERRDWQSAAKLFEQTVALAPRFGLARLQLAEAQTHLSQASAAVNQMESARALLQPAPAEVSEALRVRRLAMEPARYREAEAALAQLARHHPERKDYLIERARKLVTAGEPQQARKLLSGADWRRESIETRIAYRLAQADIAGALGEIEAARSHATTAELLARQAGEGWKPERADALMELAWIDWVESKAETSTRRYQQAAQLLEGAGDQTRALYARFLADSSQPPGEVAQHLNPLLAKAREGGYPRMEIGILQIVSSRFHEAGDYTRSRRHLEQAWNTAQAASDTVARETLDLLLVGDDLADLRLDSMHTRLRRLESVQPQGARAMLVAMYRAMLSGIRGEPANAIRILDTAEKSQGSDGRLPAAFSSLNCTRASYRLTTGDLARARADLKRCEATASADEAIMVALGRAQTELMAGDNGAARTLLEPLGPKIDAIPEPTVRWSLELERAALLTRAGNPAEAERIYARISSQLPASGTAHLRAALETGLAENEAALGRWASSGAHMQAAGRLLPDDAWSYQARLKLVEAVGDRIAGRDADAIGHLRSLHAQAHQRHDVGTMLEVHTLLPDGFAQGDCTRAQRERLVAQTGMRGAGADWLVQADASSRQAQL